MAGSRTQRASRPVAIGLLLALATWVAYAPRVDHYRAWQRDHSTYFADQVVRSNPDSYYWFRVARELRSGRWYEGDLDPLRRYPDGSPRGSAPWVSRAIACVAEWTDGDVYRAGLWLMLLGSCLFVVPLGLFAARVGWPAAGILGALVGAASTAVVGRTGIHRVDTDSINLFALWWICLIFALPRPEHRTWRQIVTTVVAGASVAGFIAWYNKPGLYPVLVATFGLSLFASRFAARRLMLLVALLLLCSNPLVLRTSVAQLSVHLKNYARLTLQPAGANEQAAGESAQPSDGAESAAWSPLAFGSFRIEEMRRQPPAQALDRVLSPPWLAASGLLASGAWAAWNWRLAVPLLPMAVFGCMGLLTANRFLMYLAPFAGFGLGILLTLLARRALRRTRAVGHADVLACVLALGAFALMRSGTAYEWQPERTVSTELLSALQRCARQVPPESPVWHSWGTSFLIQDVMGAATFTDGGGLDPVIEHLLVKALTDSDPAVLQRTLAYLDRRSHAEVRAAFLEDYAAAYQQLQQTPIVFSGSSYLLFTRNSMREFGAYARRGRWDPVSGRPGSERIRRMSCRRAARELLRCQTPAGATLRVDLKRGFLEQTAGAGGAWRQPIGRVLMVGDGFLQRERRYRHDSDLVVEIVRRGDSGAFEAYSMEGVAFGSNVNQLYVLGGPGQTALELVCDEFPEARLYRARAASEPAAP